VFSKVALLVGLAHTIPQGLHFLSLHISWGLLVALPKSLETHLRLGLRVGLQALNQAFQLQVTLICSK